MDDVGEVTREGNNDEPSSTATSPTSPTSSSPQSTSISATSTTATATSTPRSTTTVARRLQRRRRDRRERRGTVVDDSDGALVGTMECGETPVRFRAASPDRTGPRRRPSQIGRRRRPRRRRRRSRRQRQCQKAHPQGLSRRVRMDTLRSPRVFFARHNAAVATQERGIDPRRSVP